MPATRLTHKRRGIATIWTAVFLMLLVGFIGLATDTAWVLLTNHQLRNSADAAALAGAHYLRSSNDAVRTAAINYGLVNSGGGNVSGNSGSPAVLQLGRNDGNAADGDIVIGKFNRLTGAFTVDDTGHPNAVKVVARRDSGSLGGALPLIFGHIFGTDYANPVQTSIGYVAGGLGAGFLVLDPTGPCSFQVAGNNTTAVFNGSVQVNSTSNTAACSNGGPIVNAPEINVTGIAAFGNNTTITGTVNNHMPPIPDPLAGLPDPPQGTQQTSDIPPQSGDISLQPGYYPYGIKRTSGNATLAPGIYYIGGAGGNGNAQKGLDLEGGSFTCTGCMFFIKQGAVNISSNTLVNLSPIDDTNNTWWHIMFFQARDNYTGGTINGAANSQIGGTLYFPKVGFGGSGPQNYLTLNGGAGSVGVQVIAYRVQLSGNNVINLYYDGAFPGPLYTRTFLVQ